MDPLNPHSIVRPAVLVWWIEKRLVKETRMDCLKTILRISAIFGILSLKRSRTIRSFESGFALPGGALFYYKYNKITAEV